MKRFFDPALFARAFRDPLSWASLGVDLLPLIAVVTLGWGPTALVALYWLENLIIGVFTLARIIGSAFGKLTNLAQALFLAPFFTVHYGMFCFGHGSFLVTFSENPNAPSPGLFDGRALLNWALGTGDHMLLFLAAIITVCALYFVRDFILRGGYKRTDPAVEMFSPYGRIVTLHVAILLGAFLTFGLGQPMLGVLLLILIRVVFGILLSMHRLRERDKALSPPAAPVAQS